MQIQLNRFEPDVDMHEQQEDKITHLYERIMHVRSAIQDQNVNDLFDRLLLSTCEYITNELASRFISIDAHKDTFRSEILFDFVQRSDSKNL